MLLRVHLKKWLPSQEVIFCLFWLHLEYKSCHELELNATEIVFEMVKVSYLLEKLEFILFEVMAADIPVS